MVGCWFDCCVIISEYVNMFKTYHLQLKNSSKRYWMLQRNCFACQDKRFRCTKCNDANSSNVKSLYLAVTFFICFAVFLNLKIFRDWNEHDDEAASVQFWNVCLLITYKFHPVFYEKTRTLRCSLKHILLPNYHIPWGLFLLKINKF